MAITQKKEDPSRFFIMMRSDIMLPGPSGVVMMTRTAFFTSSTGKIVSRSKFGST